MKEDTRADKIENKWSEKMGKEAKGIVGRGDKVRRCPPKDEG